MNSQEERKCGVEMRKESLGQGSVSEYVRSKQGGSEGVKMTRQGSM